MNFEDIKKIVNKEGKVVIIENNEAYVVSRYESKEKTIKDVNLEVQEETEEKALNIEDLPF